MDVFLAPLTREYSEYTIGLRGSGIGLWCSATSCLESDILRPSSPEYLDWNSPHSCCLAILEPSSGLLRSFPLDISLETTGAGYPRPFKHIWSWLRVRSEELFAATC